jgi:hypothetical protein
MDVSVIIINYNTCELSIQCIQSIINHTSGIDYEIIVVDNNSSDSSAQYIIKAFPEIAFQQNTENLGFGRANNIGILQSCGKYVFLLNSDTYITDNALKTFFNFMEDPRNAQVACCGGSLFQANGVPQVSYGNFPSLLESLSEIGFYVFYKRYFLQHISTGVINDDQYVKEVEYISGADMFIRKTVLNQVGLFDEDFFLYFEETELSLRFKRAGFLSILLPSVKIIHLEGASTIVEPGLNYSKLEHFAKSKTLFFRKCFGPFRAYLMKMLYCLRMITLFALNRQGNIFKTIRIIANA